MTRRAVPRISYVDAVRAGRDLDRPAIRAVVAAALAEDSHPPGDLVVRIVDDAESARLHGEHFSDPTPTDVMTFPDGTTDPATGRLLLGDLAVGIDVARRVAAERGRRPRDEMTLYVLHGLLHILGYDDRDDADRAEMWEAQRRLLATVGIVLDGPG
jgi:probable rRNA maturation factor